MMPAVSASAARSLPSYQAPPVGRATEGMTATAASLRTAALISRDQRRDDVAAPVEERGELAAAPRVGEPERLRHVVRQIEVAGEIDFDVVADPRPQPLGVDAGRLRARQAMLAEAEAELAVEPAVLLHQREFVVDSRAT